MTAELVRIPARVLEKHALRSEDAAAWGRVIHLGKRLQTAVVAERDDVIEQAAGELIHIGSRRLRQIGGSNDAA